MTPGPTRDDYAACASFPEAARLMRQQIDIERAFAHRFGQPPGNWMPDERDLATAEAVWIEEMTELMARVVARLRALDDPRGTFALVATAIEEDDYTPLAI